MNKTFFKNLFSRQKNENVEKAEDFQELEIEPKELEIIPLEDGAGDKIEEIFFYRIFGQDDFVATTEPKTDFSNICFLKTNALTNTCETLSEQTEDSFLLEYASPFRAYDYDYRYNYVSKEDREFTLYENQNPSFFPALRYLKSKFEKEARVNKKREEREILERARFDKNGDDKDFFFARLKLNWTRFGFEVKARKIIRSYWMNEKTVPEIEISCKRFSFKTGETQK